MTSKREMSPPMRMRKIAVVICEGETEECYVNLLRQWYKSPVRIVSYVEGTKITPSLVESRTREAKISARDSVSTFLMYDMDVSVINEKLQKCKAIPLLSNPCFEFWILLHVKEQTTTINTEMVIRELEKSASVWKNYAKSSFTETQRAFLKAHTEIAIERAKSLKEFQNPSTGIYKLVEILRGTAQFAGGKKLDCRLE